MTVKHKRIQACVVLQSNSGYSSWYWIDQAKQRGHEWLYGELESQGYVWLTEVKHWAKKQEPIHESTSIG